MPWTAAHQAPLSMGFSRQEHWSRLPFPPPGDFPKPGIEPEPPVSPTLAGRLSATAPQQHTRQYLRAMPTGYMHHRIHSSQWSETSPTWNTRKPGLTDQPPAQAPLHTHTLRQRDSEVHTPTHTCPLMIQSPRPQIYLQDTWQFLDNLTSLHQTENFKEKLANFSEVILFHFFISLKRQAFILNNIILIFFFCNWC